MFPSSRTIRWSARRRKEWPRPDASRCWSWTTSRRSAALLAEFFSDAEFEVTTAADVPTALAVLPNGFDVLVSDIRMPGQSGIDLLQQAKTQHPAMGVFLITGYPTIDTVVDAKCHGAQAYFRKPLDLEAMERRIREFLATVSTGAHQPDAPEGAPGIDAS